MSEVTINYWAILFCGIIGMVFGYLWYSPFLFGKFWLSAIDKTEDELKKDFKPIKTFGLTFLSNLFIAYVIARLMVLTNASTIEEGIRISFLCWLGFTFATNFINAQFEKKEVKLLLIDSGFHMVVTITYGTILGIFI
ncbi:MAG: DUF1761 domain-containing protein [Melioribacteraceae bacterium]|nr:DUF1761 domain-containing protein [Melioribacteraceae bacterium]